MVKWPFRVGTTSYIYPDEILSNVQKLKDRVDDVELVLFESDSDDNIPGAKEIRELIRTAKKYRLTYTVHLPLDIDLGGEVKARRENSVKKAVAFINATAALDPYAYILHLNLSRQAEKDIRRWQERAGGSLMKLLGGISIPSTDIVVENLGYPFRYVDDLLVKHNLSVCVDIGHLVNAGTNVLKHLCRYQTRMRVIHWHGVDRGKDHVSLKYCDGKHVRQVLRFLNASKYRGVLTLEVFSLNDFEESMSVLSRQPDSVKSFMKTIQE